MVCPDAEFTCFIQAGEFQSLSWLKIRFHIVLIQYVESFKNLPPRVYNYAGSLRKHQIVGFHVRFGHGNRQVSGMGVRAANQAYTRLFE
jgi:hypothetical protein